MNWKFAAPPGLVSEMVKSADKVGVEMITELRNQITIEGVILEEWELSAILRYDTQML